ncbi:hypothetical protein [Chitiniphilus eburneus]|uniref:Uncharacterized protein n=1 Tax=Chitiniphilus eburneus TaxID=2571148 RepID=A0A4U0Q7E8_9NEIS|nr:hypothetical protein [Chitiniphilus eburneus]TJZ76202.1 hypothetical protein FAZ21_05350 [Chitiniphilus eburneus]
MSSSLAHRFVAVLCTAILLPALLHAAPTDAVGGGIAVTAQDYYSEDHASQRRGGAQQLAEDIDVFTGGVRLGIPLLSIPGKGSALTPAKNYPGQTLPTAIADRLAGKTQRLSGIPSKVTEDATRAASEIPAGSAYSTGVTATQTTATVINSQQSPGDKK